MGGLTFRLAAGRDGRFRLSWPQIARTAFMLNKSKLVIAESMGVSARTVGRVQLGVAAALMATQKVWLEWTLENLKRHPPSIAVSSTLWDETGERLVLPMLNGTGAMSHQMSSTWHVLVSRIRFVWSWIGPGGVSSMAFEVAVPPLPLLATRAEDLAGAFQQHPAMSDVNRFKKSLFEVVREAGGRTFDLREADGATSNDRFHAWTTTRSAQDSYTELLLCGNHGNQLLEAHVKMK